MTVTANAAALGLGRIRLTDSGFCVSSAELCYRPKLCSQHIWQSQWSPFYNLYIVTMVTTLRKLNWKFFDSVLHGCVVQIMTGDNTSVTQTDPRWQDCQVASHEQFQSGQGHGFRAGSPGLGVMLVENHVLLNQRDIMIINQATHRHQQHPSSSSIT